MNRAAVAAILLVVLLAGAAIGAWWWLRTRSPEYSLAQLGAAIRSHHRLRIEEYLDVHAVAEAAVEDFLRTGMAEALKKTSIDSPLEALGTGLGMGMLQNMKPLLTQQLESAFWTLAGDSSDAPASQGAVMTLSKVDLTRVRYRGIVASERLGSRARVSVRFGAPAPDTSSVVIPLRLERAGHHWRVVAADLPSQLFKDRTNSDPPERATIAAMKSDLHQLYTAEEAYFADSGKYGSVVLPCSSLPTEGAVLWCATTGNVLGEIRLATGAEAGWTASIRNRTSNKTCAMYVGAVTPAPPATARDPEGTPVCR